MEVETKMKQNKKHAAEKDAEDVPKSKKRVEDGDAFARWLSSEAEEEHEDADTNTKPSDESNEKEEEEEKESAPKDKKAKSKAKAKSKKPAAAAADGEKKIVKPKAKPKKKEMKPSVFGELVGRQKAGLLPFVKAFQGFPYTGPFPSPDPLLPLEAQNVQLEAKRSKNKDREPDNQAFFNKRELLFQLPWLRINHTEQNSEFCKWLVSLNESCLAPTTRNSIEELRSFFLEFKKLVLSTYYEEYKDLIMQHNGLVCDFMDENPPYGETLNLSCFHKANNISMFDAKAISVYNADSTPLKPTKVQKDDYVAALVSLSVSPPVLSKDGSKLRVFFHFHVKQAAVVKDESEALKEDAPEYEEAVTQWRMAAAKHYEAAVYQAPAKSGKKKKEAATPKKPRAPSKKKAAAAAAAESGDDITLNEVAEALRHPPIEPVEV